MTSALKNAAFTGLDDCSSAEGGGGDFNGDGVQDLVAANSFSNTVSALLSNGDGTAFSVLLLRRYPQDAPVVHDPSTHHGEHRRNRADVVCGHGEVVVAQNDQVGVLAGLERANAPLLSKIPGAVDGLCAERLHPRQSLFGGNAGHVGIERPAADDVP